MVGRLLDRLEEVIIATLIGAATVLIFVAVVHRYCVGVKFLYPFFYRFDFTWAQELCIYMFVWMAKFGAAYGVRTGIHVGVDVLVNLLKPDKKRWIILSGLGSGAFFTALIAVMGAKFVMDLAGTDQVSPDLEWPRWMIFLCVPLGSTLMSFRFLQVAWHFYKSGDLPHHDPGEVEGLDLPPPVLASQAATGLKVTP